MIYALTERKLGISDQVQCVVTIVLHCYRDIGRVVQEKREFLRKSRNLDTKKNFSCQHPCKTWKCTNYTRKSKHTGMRHAHYKSSEQIVMNNGVILEQIPVLRHLLGMIPTQLPTDSAIQR